MTQVDGFDPVGEDHRPTVTVRTYLPADAPDTPARQRQIEEGLWHLGRIHPIGEPQIRRLAEEDWANAWKSSYHPLRIGRSLLIIPAWLTAGPLDVAAAQAPEASADLLPIILDPGMAFGTGLHPSTQLCMIAMEDVVRPGHRVLDAGCGSGILSIAAARLGAISVDAFDIDPLAVRATKSNAALNDLSIPINAFVSPGPDENSFWRPATGSKPSWDVILVNILPHVIQQLLDRELHTFLATDGRLILAGIIHERELDVRAALAPCDLSVVGRSTQGDWVALTAKA